MVQDGFWIRNLLYSHFYPNYIIYFPSSVQTRDGNFVGFKILKFLFLFLFLIKKTEIIINTRYCGGFL